MVNIIVKFQFQVENQDNLQEALLGSLSAHKVNKFSFNPLISGSEILLNPKPDDFAQ